jgi:hypothetical protein
MWRLPFPMHRGAAAIRYGVANLFGSEKDRGVDKDYLILKRASASRPSGQWNEEDFDVLANGEVVGRIFKANAAPVSSPWMWTLAFGHHGKRRRRKDAPRKPLAVVPFRVVADGLSTMRLAGHSPTHIGPDTKESLTATRHVHTNGGLARVQEDRCRRPSGRCAWCRCLDRRLGRVSVLVHDRRANGRYPCWNDQRPSDCCSRKAGWICTIRVN